MKMKNEPQPGVELIPSPAAIVRARTGVDEAELHRLVQQKVAEIMAERDAVVFEPFFRSRQIAYELKRLQTVSEQEKFAICFERYGCICCETRESIHAGNGMCGTCRAKWFYRLTQIVAEGVKGEPARPALGTPLAERHLPPNADGVHRTWARQSTETEKAIHTRIAERLGVSRQYVMEVARGQHRSKTVEAALREDEVSQKRKADGSKRPWLQRRTFNDASGIK